MTEAKQKTRWYCVVARLLALVIVGAGIVLFVVWQDRTTQIEAQIVSFLEGQHVSSARVSVDEVSPSALSFSSFEIGPEDQPDLVLERGRVQFDLSDLLYARVADIHVEKALLRARVGDDGLQFGDLSPLFSAGGVSEGGSGDEGFPFSSVTIDDLQIDLMLPEGRVRLAAAGMVSDEGGRLVINLQDRCLAFDAERLNLGAVFADPVSGKVCLSDPASDLTWPLSTTIEGGDAPQLSLRATSSPVHLRSDRGELMMSIDAPELALMLGGPSLSEAALSLMTPKVYLPGAAIDVADVKADLAIADVLTLDGHWTIRDARLVDRAAAPRFSDLRVAGEGTLSPQAIAFELALADLVARPLGQVRGQHDISTGAGRARATLGVLGFEDGGLQPQELLPSLVGVIANAVGNVSGTFDFAWRKGALQSSGDLSFDQFGFSTAAARSEGVTGIIKLDRLVPPRTAQGQVLTVGSLDAGLLLKDGTILFSIESGGGISIEEARWPFAGGVIRLSSGSIVPGAAEQSLSLEVERVDLKQFLEMLRIDGASGTGIVSGVVPVVVRGGDVWIEGAVLRAADNGHLSYKSATSDAVAQGQSALLFQALEDFQYTVLEVSLEGNALDRLNVGLKLEGANPGLYDGYPFAINVTTEASFAELMQSATVGTRALDMVRELDLQQNFSSGAE